MIFPEFDPVLIHFGPLAIRWYALAYIAGVLFAWWYVSRLLGRETLWGADGAPLSRRQLGDLMFWVVLGVLLGGRLGYVLFYATDMLWRDPARVFAIWQGGMSFHGGLLGVTAAVAGYAARAKISLLSLADAACVPTPLALCFGRIANFINGELWGRPTDLPWGIVFPRAGELPRHPSQLYQAALEGLLLFLILHFLAHRTPALRHPGMLAGVFLLGYGLLRFVVEPLREPEIYVGLAHYGITMGMALNVPMILVGAALVAGSRMRAQDEEEDAPSPVLVSFTRRMVALARARGQSVFQRAGSRHSERP